MSVDIYFNELISRILDATSLDTTRFTHVNIVVSPPRPRVCRGEMQHRGMSGPGLDNLRLQEDAFESGSWSRGDCSRFHTDIGDLALSRFPG